MLEGLFGNPVIEKIFFTLVVYSECYALGLAKTFNEPVNKFQQQLKRLEEGGLVVSRLVGNTRLYTFNPRYPFLKELSAFLSKAFEFVPAQEKEKYYRKRTRPRRQGKPL
ncbi:MAG: winged helix-turn-helix transcriptional regulator [Nitrospira sp.]|nr:winged helix-turn-helix transcriptional regulator [bacterium]MBL7048343.1 winged helix-turn-helix transcriptional regulator [Nitrospira sp.]